MVQVVSRRIVIKVVFYKQISITKRYKSVDTDICDT